ncbi:MAG: carboxypeptidase regulatory-like domain-containing protein [Bacteroidetes bacterium]|nr:carboxypeptidase regulatory-like domain-containing protein [Bacteroidota bacterium]
MKKFLYTLLILAGSGMIGKMNAARYLELSGKIFQTGFDVTGTEKYLDSARLIILNTGSGRSDTFLSAESGEYIFRLPVNNNFLITISHKGFVSKKISADTHVPVFTTGYFGIEFELALFKSVPGPDISLLETPIAAISYSRGKKCFDYNHNYTDQVNCEVKKQYTAYYQHRPMPAARKPVAQENTFVKHNKGGKKKALRISKGKIKK